MRSVLSSPLTLASLSFSIVGIFIVIESIVRPSGVPVSPHVDRIVKRLGWISNVQPADPNSALVLKEPGTISHHKEDTRKVLEGWGLPLDLCVGFYGGFHSVLRNFGLNVCVPFPAKPKCTTCPVREYCPSNYLGQK